MQDSIQQTDARNADKSESPVTDFSRPLKDKPNRAVSLLTVSAMIAAVVFVYFSNPREAWYLPRCLFHSLTGLHCPGCGGLRATYSFLHGDFSSALSSNAMVVLFVYPLLGYVFVDHLMKLVRGRGLPEIRISALTVWIMVFAIIIFTILRNLPFPPFMILAP